MKTAKTVYKKDETHREGRNGESKGKTIGKGKKAVKSARKVASTPKNIPKA